MTHEVNNEISDTILQAEENILRIAEELSRMKTAAEQLDEAGKRSLLLQEAVENLVFEIGILVELSGRVIDTLDASEVRGLVKQMRTVLSRRMDGLRTELLENTKSTADRVAQELQTALVHRIESLENELTKRTETAANQVCSSIMAVDQKRMTESERILKRLDELDSQVGEVQELTEDLLKQRGTYQ